MAGKSEIVEITPTASVTTRNESGGELEKETSSYNLSTIVIVFLLFAAVSCFLNAKVIHVVLFKLSRLARPVPLLVAHLAGISIFLGLTSLFYTNDAVSLVHVPESMCRPMSYMRNVLFSAFSLNIFFIIYERLGPSRQHQNKALITRWIFIIWFVPLMFSVPTVGMVKPRLAPLELDDDIKNEDKSLESCIPIPLFGSIYATVLYEMLRLGLFHGVVAIYMVYALLTIRAKMKYLKKNSATPNERLKRKIHSIRLIYFHLISFTLISIPAGLYVFFRRVSSRTDLTSYFGTDQDGDIPVENVKVYIALAVFLYFMINPIISLFLLENNLRCSFHCFCCISIENIHCQSEYEFLELTTQQKNLKDAWTQMRDARQIGSTHTLSSSRYSTIAVTSTIELEERGEIITGNIENAVDESQTAQSSSSDQMVELETWEVKADSHEQIEMRAMKNPYWRCDQKHVLQTRV